MISSASSPSTVSTTRPRTWAILYGSSWSVIEIATRGSAARLRALREPGWVKKAMRSPSSATQTGTLCGAPLGNTVATWAKFARWNSARTLSGSSAMPRIVAWQDAAHVAPRRGPRRLRARRGRGAPGADRRVRDTRVRADAPGRVAAGAGPRARRRRRGARGLRPAAQRGQLRLRLVPDAAQAGGPLGLPHRRGGAEGPRAVERAGARARRCRRGGGRVRRAGPRARADGAVRARAERARRARARSGTAAPSSRSPAAATARR